MIHIVEAPKGAKVSDKFSVWVRQKNAEWQQVAVYLALEPDGDMLGCLHLFAEASKEFAHGDYEHVIYFEKGYHTAENNEHITYNEHGFPVVTVNRDNTLVYAEQGAVVCASVEIINVSHVKVAGYGIFSLLERCYGAENDFNIPVLYSGFREYALPTIYVHAKCEDIILQDVTLLSEFRGICIRNTKNILIDNVKIFSHVVNGDGINGINVCNMEVKNCYIHSSDDCFALFTSADSITTLYDEPEFTLKPRVANICMHDCILWSNARIFMIGGHGTNCKEPHDVVEDVKIYDCEIVGDACDLKAGRTYEYRMYWTGVFRILSQSEQWIRNIVFENIRADWVKGFVGKPFHIEVRDGKRVSYSEIGGGYRIENVIFKNIQFINMPAERMPTYIKSIEKGEKAYGVENITFENVIFNENVLCEEEMLREGNVLNISII